MARPSPTRGNAAALEQRGLASSADASTAALEVSTAESASAQRAPLPEPVPATNPLPVQEGVQRRRVLGVDITGTNVSPSALDACERFLTDMLARRPDIQRRLATVQATLVIVPRDGRMTDLPQFSDLAGQTTFDGRPWEEVRGSGGMASGGAWNIGIAEETLIHTEGSAYGEGTNVGMHEFAHTLHTKGLSREERARVTALYEARRRAGGPWTEAYGASNELEYFAQATNCYFRQNKGIGQNDPGWLEANDPGLYAFLGEVYGPAPDTDVPEARAREAVS